MMSSEHFFEMIGKCGHGVGAFSRFYHLNGQNLLVTELSCTPPVSG